MSAEEEIAKLKKQANILRYEVLFISVILAILALGGVL